MVSDASSDAADGTAAPDLLDVPPPTEEAAPDPLPPVITQADTDPAVTSTTEVDLDVDSAAEAPTEVLAGRGSPLPVSDAPDPPPTTNPPASLGAGAESGGVPQSQQPAPQGNQPAPGGGGGSDGGSGGGSAPSPTAASAPAPQQTNPPSATTPTTAPPTTAPPPPPTTTAPPAPQASFSSCTVLDPSPVNGWRAQAGLPPLASSSSLASASCAWSLEMAKARSLTHGAANEVIHYSSQSGGAFGAWRNSSAHYNLLVTSDPRVTQIGCGMVRADYPDGATLYWSTCRMNW